MTIHRYTIGDFSYSTPRALTAGELVELRQLVIERSNDAMLARLREMTRGNWDWRLRYETAPLHDQRRGG